VWRYGDVGPSALRVGFGIDVVGYSDRAFVASLDAQSRALALVDALIAAIGFDVSDTDRQPSGDGMIVFLPASAELRRVLPALTGAAMEWLRVDNRRYQDRLRLRMAVVVGPVGPAPMGFSGKSVIECARLLDSQVLRQAMAADAASDLGVLVSDVVHSYVVREGYPGIDAGRFRRVDAQAKNFQAQAWLWMSSGDGDADAGPAQARERDELDPDLAHLRVVTTVDHERLFGVDDELTRLGAYLSNRSGDFAISIWGPPGVGKTALAYELVLRHARAAGFHRVAAVSAKFSHLNAGGMLGLGQARLAIDWRDLLVDVARQLSLPINAVPASIEQELPRAMPDAPCLILIDNLETVPQAQVAVKFLTESATLDPHKVVLTTRTSVAVAADRNVRERHWTGPDRPASLDYARYLAGDDPTLDPRPSDLNDVVDAAERTPLLIRLIIQQAIFQRLPVREVIARLRQRVGGLGSAVWQYLYADSLDALAEHVGMENAAQLMSVFCAKAPGSAFTREELFELSEIGDGNAFDRAVAAACRLTLVRSFAGNTRFTVHSLLREFYCSDVDRRPD
jgi:hypothetical protein